MSATEIGLQIAIVLLAGIWFPVILAHWRKRPFDGFVLGLLGIMITSILELLLWA